MCTNNQLYDNRKRVAVSFLRRLCSRRNATPPLPADWTAPSSFVSITRRYSKKLLRRKAGAMTVVGPWVEDKHKMKMRYNQLLLPLNFQCMRLCTWSNKPCVNTSVYTHVGSMNLSQCTRKELEIYFHTTLHSFSSTFHTRSAVVAGIISPIRAYGLRIKWNKQLSNLTSCSCEEAMISSSAVLCK